MTPPDSTNMSSRRLNSFFFLVGALASALAADSAVPEVLQSVVVTGTRQLGRSSTDSLAPVDVVPATVVRASVSSELTDVLMQSVPSFNVQRLTIGEGLAFVRPARLRGLSPDQTLVLVNGRRQHRSAFISPSGYQAVDLGQIASFALQRVEVLRDGASAQYGSDAIAGVINLVLRDTVGFEGYGQVAQYFGGDGLNRQAGINYGFPVGEGVLNLGYESSNAERTSRSVQRADALAYVRAHPERSSLVPSPVQRWGQPDRRAQRLSLNGRQDLAGGMVLYGHWLLGFSDGLDDFNWRNPDTNAAFRRSAFQSGPAAIQPSFLLLGWFPGGFTPYFGTKDLDWSALLGLRGTAGPEWRWDVAAGAGRNRLDYFLRNTVNASFGEFSPREFDAGGLRQAEWNLNADLVYQPKSWELARPTTVAFGAESRREAFRIRPGDRFSWDVGPLADLPVGANGFPGWSPRQAVDASRRSEAAYVDVEASPLRGLAVGLAGRTERFSDFGSTHDGKISVRWEAASGFALRGTSSTGFHAPTPGLSNYTRTSQGLLPGTSTLFTSGQIAVANPVAQFLGARPLRPETAVNSTLGVVWSRQGFTLTADAYRIDVSDRLNISQSFALTAVQRAQLVATGVTDAANLNSVNFLTNAFDTRTQGIDLSATRGWRLSSGVRLTAHLAWNLNRTRAVRFDPRIISADGRTNLERRIPGRNGSFGISADHPRWAAQARLRFFGPWTDAQSNSTIVQEFGSQALVDLNATWKLGGRTSVVGGAENLLNRYPDKALFNAANGLVYSRNSPYDSDGGRWYLRFNAGF
jgi:iron complex outermembrane recepter protein